MTNWLDLATQRRAAVAPKPKDPKRKLGAVKRRVAVEPVAAPPSPTTAHDKIYGTKEKP